jgi:hypothetical protein
VGVDGVQPLMHLGQMMAVLAMLGVGQQGGAFLVIGQHRIDQAVRPVRGFLRHIAHTGAGRKQDGARVRRQLALDQFEQGRFAGAVASDQPDSLMGRDLHAGIVEKNASANAVSKVADRKHEGLIVGSSSLVKPVRCNAA